MTEYCVFQRIGRVWQTVIKAADDQAAITVAQRFLHGSDLQLWQGGRLVTTLSETSHLALDAERPPRFALPE